MSIEAPSRPLPVSILSPQPSSPRSPGGLDATFISGNVQSILSHQAESFTTSLVSPSPVLLDRRASSLSISASATPSDADKEDGVMEIIIEALKGKDRLFVLRVGELIESLINERKPRVEVATSTSYQRLLVHKCSEYYKVTQESESSRSIVISFSSGSRVPSRRVSELVPAESTKQPAFKIMRRSAHDRARSKPQSRTGSVGGDDLELSDVEPSETGSQGGRSSALGSKKNLTLEERAAAYNEARSRIFMNFEEKATEKENDMSASSSTFSLVSGSASTSGGGSSSAGDIEDSVSSAATESEWSAPVTRENKSRAGSGANSVGSSSRSQLSSAHASSSRNSRAASPSYTYNSIYEPPQPPAAYDPSQASGQAPQPYMQQQPYLYPYVPPGQNQGQGYMPYPYYTYPYHPHMSNSDPTTPSPEGMYIPHHPAHMQQMPYMPQYGWVPAPGAPQGGVHSAAPSPSHAPGYAPYGHMPYGGYPMAGYFPPPPPGQGMPHMPGQQPMFPMEVPPQMNGNADGIGVGNNNGNNMNAPFARPPLRNGSIGNGGSSSGGSNGSNGAGKRNKNGRGPAWSYGPGVSGGYPFSGSSGMNGGGSGIAPVENYGPVGPRLSNSMRKTSGNSSSSNGNRTPGDEASSVASSTSSSSRRTFTSTTSSQHPLPARPDWAVGLKAQPTLHPITPHGRHHDHNNHAGPMSPVRNGGRLPHGPHTVSAPVLLQPADFPPLTSPSGAAEKRAPAPRGAWNNPATRSTILSPPAPQAQQGGAPNGHTPAGPSRLDEPDQAFERPQPKGKAELFNPKDKDGAALAEKIVALGVEDGQPQAAEEGSGGRS